MSKDLPVLDLKDALHRALGDVAFLKMMFDEFQQMLPEMMAAMAREVEAGDLVAVGKTAHQLKGAAANLGAGALSHAALALERLGKSGDANRVRGAMERLKSAQQTLFATIEEIDWASLAEP